MTESFLENNTSLVVFQADNPLSPAEPEKHPTYRKLIGGLFHPDTDPDPDADKAGIN
jgi:hypothetical protein